MIKNNVFELTMESNAFASLKSDFDQILRRTLANMECKESEQAELTIKLKVSLEKFVAPNSTRDIVKPTFKHKISSVMQIKDEKSGYLGGNYELIWDGERGDYIIRPLDDGQMDFYSCAEQQSDPLVLPEKLDNYDYTSDEMEERGE